MWPYLLLHVIIFEGIIFHGFVGNNPGRNLGIKLKKFAEICYCQLYGMAKIADGIICLHMFSIVMVKTPPNTYILFSSHSTLQIHNYQKKEQFLAIRIMPRRSQRLLFRPSKHVARGILQNLAMQLKIKPR